MSRREFRQPHPLDRLLAQLDHALRTTLAEPEPAARPNPAEAGAAEDQAMDEADRRHAAGLMRVNHAGEVCAQALYLGQAAVARDAATRAALLQAAREEGDHLAWCGQRLGELGSRPSLLNPLWYAGSYAIGALAGMAGDGYNLGFVVETERQVEAHLGDHLERLPPGDRRSRAIVRQMQADEVEHGHKAQEAGARELPGPVPALMRAVSAVMKFAAYRV